MGKIAQISFIFRQCLMAKLYIPVRIEFLIELDIIVTCNSGKALPMPSQSSTGRPMAAPSNSGSMELSPPISADTSPTTRRRGLWFPLVTPLEGL